VQVVQACGGVVFIFREMGATEVTAHAVRACGDGPSEVGIAGRDREIGEGEIRRWDSVQPRMDGGPKRISGRLL